MVWAVWVARVTCEVPVLRANSLVGANQMSKRGPSSPDLCDQNLQGLDQQRFFSRLHPGRQALGRVARQHGNRRLGQNAAFVVTRRDMVNGGPGNRGPGRS